MNLQMMSVQSNTIGRRLDIDLDLYNALEAKRTAELQVEELDVVVNSFDADLINTRPLAIEDRTYVSGKMLRSEAAMVITDLRRDDFGKCRL